MNFNIFEYFHLLTSKLLIFVLIISTGPGYYILTTQEHMQEQTLPSR